MHKVILVIDTAFSVTPEQYEPAYRTCRNNGHIPVVVRTTFDNLFLDADALAMTYGVVTPAVISLVDGAESLRLAAEHVACFGDISDIVMTQQAYDDWEALEDNDVSRLLRESGAIRWVVNDLTGRAESFGR